ncbi:MAG: dUTP diphosphatase [Synergistaceae bacterium]|jgi:dUTP pyrophosphatase|nr:dUTP diphosphatase [Synergistaceae bacterium]
MAGVVIKVMFRRDAAASRVPSPSYATAGSAGMDLRASERAALLPGEYKSLGTGLSLEIPPGFEGQVRPRSGLAAKHGVTLLNSPGTIDSDYRGEVRVILINHGEETFTIEPGDRIAQIIFSPALRAELEETEDLSGTKRSTGGFGSTGVK